MTLSSHRDAQVTYVCTTQNGASSDGRPTPINQLGCYVPWTAKSLHGEFLRGESRPRYEGETRKHVEATNTVSEVKSVRKRSRMVPTVLAG